MPQQHLGILLVGLSAGEAHELELHAPRRAEVEPALPGRGAGAGDRLAHDLHPVRAQVRDGGLQVIDVEGEVMPADVAVARLRCLAVGAVVLEQLDVAAAAEPIEADLADHGARMDTELDRHPIVVVRPLGAERVDVHGAQDVDQEPLGLVEVGNREPDVVDPADSRNPHAAPPVIGSIIAPQRRSVQRLSGESLEIGFNPP